jgi:acetyl-CoA C-acetyltransferase
MKAVVLAAQAIKAGDAQVIIAGGMENMNQAPFLLRKARFGYRLGDEKLVDAMVNDGLWDYYNDFHMGITGELIAEKYGLSREEVDAFALRSNVLAIKATSEGKFRDEILPLEVPQRKSDPIIFDADEGPRNTSLEKLARLPAAFQKGGLVTAGNSSQLSDGASALSVMSGDYARENGIKPLAIIKEYESGGTEPGMVMNAPVVVTRQMFERTGMSMKDIDLVEHNEAFASASVAVQKAFDIPDDKFNVHGGAVSMGHPIGCSGARILTTMIYAMKDRGDKTGLATICLGGGNAVTMVLEV